MSHMISRRLAVGAAIAAATALLTAACGGNSGSSDGSSGVTLTLWHQSADTAAQLDLYKAYEKATGNTIKLVTLPADTYPTAVQTKWATGDRPDILEYAPTPQDMASLNVPMNMVDLSSMSFVSKRINTSGDLDGKTYAAVLGPLSSFGLFYNKDVLAKAGVSAPTNYTALQSDCSAIKATGADPVSIGAGSEFPANMIAGFAYMADYNADDAYGKAVASGKTKVDASDSPIVAGLTAVSKLVKDGCVNSDVATATFQDSIKAVYDGKAAMTILPSDFISQFYDLGKGDTAAVDAKVGFGAISAERGIASYSASPIGSYLLPKTSDSAKQAAAKDFIDWITTDGYQTYINAVKAVPTLRNASLPSGLRGMESSLASILRDPDTTPAFNQSIPGFGSFGQIAVSVIVGQSTPEEAAKKWQTDIDQAIQAQQ